MTDNINNTDTAVVEEDAGMSQIYINGLKESVSLAKRKLNQYTQAAQKSSSEYHNAKAFCGELEDYVDRIKFTYEWVIQVEDYIGALIGQAGNVCENANKTLKALKSIIQAYKCVVDQTETLQQMVKSLLDAIDRLANPNLTSEDSLVKCLKDLESKIKETLELQNTTLTSLLEVWRTMTELSYLLCNNRADTDGPSGLIYDLEQLNKILCCEYCGGSADNVAPCPTEDPVDVDSDELSDEEQLNSCCTKPNELTEPQCQGIKPALCADMEKPGFNSDFYCDLEKEKKNTCDLKDHKLCIWNFYEKKKQNAVTKYEAVKAAFEAAKKAKDLCN